MKEEVWKSPYDVEISEVRVINQPRSAELTLSNGSAITKLILINPKPLSQLVESLDECWEVAIIDENILENNQLDFGRYQVQINDEENNIASIQCNGYSIEEIQG